MEVIISGPSNGASRTELVEIERYVVIMMYMPAITTMLNSVDAAPRAMRGM